MECVLQVFHSHFPSGISSLEVTGADMGMVGWVTSRTLQLGCSFELAPLNRLLGCVTCSDPVSDSAKVRPGQPNHFLRINKSTELVTGRPKKPCIPAEAGSQVTPAKEHPGWARPFSLNVREWDFKKYQLKRKEKLCQGALFTSAACSGTSAGREGRQEKRKKRLAIRGLLECGCGNDQKDLSADHHAT